MARAASAGWAVSGGGEQAGADGGEGVTRDQSKAKPVEWKYNEWDSNRLYIEWSDGSVHSAGWGPNGEAPIFTEDTPIDILIRACDYSWDMNETDKGEAAKEEAEAAAVELRRRDAIAAKSQRLARAAANLSGTKGDKHVLWMLGRSRFSGGGQ